MRIASSVGLAVLFASAMIAGGEARAAIPDGDWRTIDRDLADTRFSPLTQINRDTVSKLAPAWSYSMRAYNTASPLVIGGVMYFPAGNRVVALDADTGKEIWTFAAEPDPNPNATGYGNGFSTRGVGYWAGDASTPARILVLQGSRMLALDAATGQKATAFGDGGYINVGVSFGGTPTIADGVIEIGAATTEDPFGVSGDPRGFDVRTGRKLWEFHTVPLPGEKYHDTWGDGWWGRSGTNQWAFTAPVDEDAGVIYIPISAPSPNYWGGSRPGANVYGNSVLALDMRTGAYRWHFQTVHHDLWDIDQPSDGPLVDLTVNGQRHPAIVAVNKSSWFFEFDRRTGKPLFDVVEKPVPKGDVPGEYYSPTEPFPVKPGPLSRVSVTAADLVTADDTTPEHVAACKALWDKSGGFYNAGPYTPFLFHKDGDPPHSTVQVPGGIGGVNWGGPAADPRTGWVYVNAHDTSLVGWVEKKDPKISYSFDAPFTDQPYERASVNGKGPFFSFSAPISGQYDDKGRPVGPQAPCYKPPWARLTAIDANTGEIKFAVPLGLIEALPPGKQLVGDTGSAGPTVTAGGLVFVGATTDKRLRAFDSTTGKELWQAMLGNSGNSNPISYSGKSGKQYVAINAGGVVTVFALP